MGGQLSRSVLIYALGGGLGHARRAGALAAELGRLGARARVLLPAGRGARAGLCDVDVREVERLESATSLRRRLDRELDELGADQLVVDALPGGVLGEVFAGELGLPSTLLARLVRHAATPAVLERMAAFGEIYDLEPALSWLEPGLGARAFGPVARVAPRLDEHGPDVLVVASEPRLVPVLAKLARRLDHAGLRVWVSTVGALGAVGSAPEPVPTLELAKIAPRVVIGPAGYNLSYEALAAGVWHLALPLPRRWDDQRRRALAVAEVPASLDELETRALALARLDAPRPGRERVRPHAELASALLSAGASGSRSEEPSRRFSAKTMSQR